MAVAVPPDQRGNRTGHGDSHAQSDANSCWRPWPMSLPNGRPGSLGRLAATLSCSAYCLRCTSRARTSAWVAPDRVRRHRRAGVVLIANVGILGCFGMQH